MSDEQLCSLLRETLKILSPTEANYEPSLLCESDMIAILSKINELAFQKSLEIVRLKEIVGEDNEKEAEEALKILREKDEMFVRYSDDFDMKCAGFSTQLGQISEDKNDRLFFEAVSGMLNKRFISKGPLVHSLFQRILEIFARSQVRPATSLPSYQPSFFSGWCEISFFSENPLFFPAKLEIHKNRIVMKDEQGSVLRDYNEFNLYSLEVDFINKRISVLPIFSIRELPPVGIEVWVKWLVKVLDERKEIDR
jgi:hypothetical protein